MRALVRLLCSDLKRMWGQGLAISAILGCGVAIYVMSMSTIRSLEATYSRYYGDYRFPDVFVQLKRAPNSLAERIRNVPGVATAETRVVRDVILDIPTMIEPATGRLVSIPDRPGYSLNSIHLRQGRMPDPNQHGEVVASELFAEAHRLQPGFELDVIMGGRKERLRIVGIGISPEYIMAVPPGQFLPDNRRFGILWMPYRQMAAAFNMEGAFNDVAITVQPQASLSNVMFHVDQLSEPYGGRGAYDREDHMSHRRVADEIHQLRGMAFVSPMIFLAVATFLFNLVISRIVHNQQEQIATLRAFGYTSWEVGQHYFKLLLVWTAAGIILGMMAGFWLTQSVMDLYGHFFRFPALYYEQAWDQTGVAVLLSLAAAIIGGYSAVHRAMRLPPAVAMRPEAPASYHKSLLERLGFGVVLSPIGRMIARRLERNPGSTILSILGMALGTAILVLGSFMGDTIDYVMHLTFRLAQRQDVTLTFADPISWRGFHDVEHLPGVISAEPFRAAPVRLRNGNRSRRLSLMGLEERPRLFRVLDRQEQQVTIAREGLTISQKLAELLGADIGDEIIIEFQEGSRRRHRVPIRKIFTDYTEPGAYIHRDALHRLLQEGECLTGAFVLVDPLHVNHLLRSVKTISAVSGITIKEAAIQSFEETIAENLRPMRVINAIFACIIAFGVIFNSALIAFAERCRDLATLRVIGFTRWEVSAVLFGELTVITLAAIPLGLPIGYGFSYLATLALDTETHRFPLVVERATFAYACLVILAAAFISASVVLRMIDRLDLIAVLKVKE